MEQRQPVVSDPVPASKCPASFGLKTVIWFHQAPVSLLVPACLFICNVQLSNHLPPSPTHTFPLRWTDNDFARPAKRILAGSRACFFIPSTRAKPAPHCDASRGREKAAPSRARDFQMPFLPFTALDGTRGLNGPSLCVAAGT